MDPGRTKPLAVLGTPASPFREFAARIAGLDGRREGGSVCRPGPGWCHLLLALMLASLPTGVGAQTIRGVAVEGRTTNPVVGATIEVLRADSTPEGTVTSDRQGRFELDVAAAGRYLLRPSHPSYTFPGIESVEVGRHEIVSVVLRMGAAAIPLDRLVVTARSRDRLAGFYGRAERGGVAYFIRRDEIDRRNAALPTQLIRMTPGVLVDARAGTMDNVITMRGLTGRCPAYILLDGLPVAQQEGLSIDQVTTPELLEGVEIYPPSAVLPKEFPIVTNDCGVLAFWSRRSAFRPWTWTRAIIGATIGALILLGAHVL